MTSNLKKTANLARIATDGVMLSIGTGSASAQDALNTRQNLLPTKEHTRD
ncbi:hypothetical protein [Capsulimonas corticalis]|nr:hypothetical protein [Capsulimonas corticalis]